MGAGPTLTTVSGPIGGAGATFVINASGAVLDGFKVTRDGNNPVNWANPGLNFGGVSISGNVTGITIRNNLFTGNRTAIDINNSGGHFVLNNVIDFNRTGMIFRNKTDNMVVTNNYITNNYTVGIVFLDASGGTNIPVQSALGGNFNNNNISGNWYGQIVDRQTGGALPAPGTNLKIFQCNWYGTVNPAVTTANSTEPGGDSPFPAGYGGTDTPPGGQPDILGAASANIEYQPYLTNGTDNSSDIGFQPVNGSCNGNQYVDCSKKNDKKVIICHKGKSQCISINALQAHLAHGDLLGPCPSNNNRGEITDITDITDISEDFKLSIAPNPVISTATIKYELPLDSKVSIVLFDPQGKAISTLVDAERKAGQYNYTLDASRLQAGIYYYRMTAISGDQRFVQGQKLVIVR